jgi:hypothetical protein
VLPVLAEVAVVSFAATCILKARMSGRTVNEVEGKLVEGFVDVSRFAFEA